MLMRILCLGLCVVSAVAARASDDGLAASKERIASCFRNYVMILSSTVGPRAKDVNNQLERLKKDCLTRDFRNHWQKIAEKTDADPLLNAQDFMESWKTNVSVESLDLKKLTARVVLGTRNEAFCLAIGFKKTKSGPRIDSSIPCPNR